LKENVVSRTNKGLMLTLKIYKSILLSMRKRLCLFNISFMRLSKISNLLLLKWIDHQDHQSITLKWVSLLTDLELSMIRKVKFLNQKSLKEINSNKYLESLMKKLKREYPNFKQNYLKL